MVTSRSPCLPLSSCLSPAVSVLLGLRRDAHVRHDRAGPGRHVRRPTPAPPPPTPGSSRRSLPPHQPPPPRRSPPPDPRAPPRPPGPPTAWICSACCPPRMVSQASAGFPGLRPHGIFPEYSPGDPAVATFLKTTEISIDGARTLPREYYTSPEIFGHELEHIFTKRWLCVGREDRIPSRATGSPRPSARRASSSSGTARAATGRSTTSAATAAPGSARSTAGRFARHDPVPLPRLDLRARRPPDRRALHRRDRALRQGRLAAAPGGRGRPGKASSSSTSPTSPEPFDQAWLPLLGRFSRFNLPNLKVARTIEYDVQGQLEAAVPELLRVLPLRAGPSRAGQAHAAHQRRERPHRGPVHRRLHGARAAGPRA